MDGVAAVVSAAPDEATALQSTWPAYLYSFKLIPSSLQILKLELGTGLVMSQQANVVTRRGGMVPLPTYIRYIGAMEHASRDPRESNRETIVRVLPASRFRGPAWA